MVGYNIKISATEPSEVAKDALRLYYKFFHFLTEEDITALSEELNAFLTAAEAEAAEEETPEAEEAKPEEPEPAEVQEPDTKSEEHISVDKSALRKMLIRVRDKCGSEVINLLYEKHANGATSVSSVDPKCYEALYYAAKEYADAAD